MKKWLSTDRYGYIADNLDDIRKRIAEAEKRSPSGGPVTLLAATKTVPAEIINYAVRELGITDIGENRVQELLEKYDELEKERMNIHFIGKLQTNKVKYIIDKVCMIHSVDSLKLAAEIDKRAAAAGKVMDVLAEINVGHEESKSGIMPEDAEKFLEDLAQFRSINVRGLMTIAPICTEKSEYLKYFKKIYQIFIDIYPKKIHNIREPVLSMGMSGSFEQAIECGSTMVRIGTSIFGERNYNNNNT